MKQICECLKKHVTKLINFKKMGIKLLTNKQQESNKKEKIYYICGETFKYKYAHNEKDHFHYTSVVFKTTLQ